MKDVLEHNTTLFVHMQVTTDNPLHYKHMTSPRFEQIIDLFPKVVDFVPKIHTFNSSLPLLDYH